MSVNETIELTVPDARLETAPRREAREAPGRRARVELIAPLLVGSLILGAIAGSQVDLKAGGARLAGHGKRLSAVRIVSGSDGTPVIVAEIARRSRGRMLIWRQVPSGAFSLELIRRLGELDPGTASIPIGSGHASDGTSPGTVEATSSMLPFELSEPMASLPPGNYSAELQLRSR